MSDLLSDKALSSKALKVPALSKRTTIIRNLSSRRMTVTELSKISGLSKSTIYDNLSVLVKARLVVKEDKINQWVYYELTKKGKRLAQGIESN